MIRLYSQFVHVVQFSPVVGPALTVLAMV
jgi:hypothetical protein